MLGMNTDEITSLLVKIFLIVLSPLATKFSIDGSTTLAIATWLATGVVLGYGVYNHWNMKKVPENAKVLGVLLAIALGLFVTPARAQTPPAAPAALQQVEQVIGQVQSALNDFINFAQGLVKTDLDLAIVQANASGNAVAAKCWQTIETVQLVPIPNGAGLAWYKQRYLDLAAQYVNINQSCSTVAPVYVRLFNQTIMRMQALNL